MPRPQRSRRQTPRSVAPPYTRKPARRRDGSSTSSLTDDALADIFASLPHAADVVRCAATCARWGRVVATSAAVISRSLPPPPAVGCFLPHLAVGVFRQRKAGTAVRRTRCGFLAMASGRRLLGRETRAPIGSFFDALDGGAALHYSRPVASRNGRLVLELARETRADGVTLCVCNPMTGDAVVLPPLSGEDKPTDYYGCALFTGGDDLRPNNPRRDTRSFRLLLVYNNRRRGFTVLRCYSSDTGRWGAEARSAVSVSDGEMCHIGAAAVLRGVAFWPLDYGALGVRLDADDPGRAMSVHLLPYDCPHDWLHTRLLGVSPDNRLFLISLGMLGGDGTLAASISYFDIPGGDGDDFPFQNGRKGSSSETIRVHQMKMNCRDLRTHKLWWIGEKSGMVVFTMRDGGGAHVLNLQEGTVEKLADEGHSWGDIVGFEMDWAAYLSSMAHRL
jgi:hypothetical protein